ncbi:MAG TPA: glycosyltransferase family 2 protein [Povalibacter sp.]|uniref:glycosyltransferase family 2 protein n=1 Tax=Povalibacter sp. TaxID=1962978 RepID=UPI002C6531D3|nr:glycosyltransferase family 2 protein [Povalibacter sp.]HMN43717.1 glycosyltransferase family 2 protein [Povalibacter sp.]
MYDSPEPARANRDVPATATLPITLLVITRDEAAVIGRCLDSVPFAAEKLVIDSGSTDGTPDIARRHGAKVVHKDWLGFGAQRNFATTQASHDWILALDADEVLSPELARELEEKLPELMKSPSAGAFLRRQTWYMGEPMRWYRPMVGEKLGRIYDRRRARWSDVRVHESLRFDGPTRTFRQRMIHHHNPTLLHRQLKILHYTELKTRDWLDKQRPTRLWLAPFVFMAAFLKDYVLRLGFLDGGRGYVVSQVAASYAVYKRLRYYEMVRNPASRDHVDKFNDGFLP